MRQSSILLTIAAAATSVNAFVVPRTLDVTRTVLYGDAPSDYDSSDLGPEKSVSVSVLDEDEEIRVALKQELMLLSSISNRGEYASKEERDIAIDLVAQLEALNPTEMPASSCEGEWDLCLSSTQFFRTSPFFQSIRVALGDENKAIAENGFDIHDRATTASRIGRVRQKISADKLVSEVDLEVGPLTGFPIRVKGTVVTTASLEVVSSETWETKIQMTQVKGSNIPLLNQFMDDLNFELPVADAYNMLSGSVPVVPLKTYYVDDGIRITRDVDDNFFVFSRA
uniref:Plastid lipid-associated protein/fibrillin conserved domain-containing protein n=1 Tax=Cyclophora tenuis TaxID=216820 RepID=A0A7S1D4Q9_CYCTE|mmetsp:Transcript_20134/g.34384  ORF Transcript_20134/g.34384 Transcript_20134/m.34384 type:complete len:283 (+) Transcript_20134:134-982(+)